MLSFDTHKASNGLSAGFIPAKWRSKAHCVLSANSNLFSMIQTLLVPDGQIRCANIKYHQDWINNSIKYKLKLISLINFLHLTIER